MTVLMLSDGECCTSASQNNGHDGHDNTHASSELAGSGRPSQSGRRSDGSVALRKRTSCHIAVFGDMIAIMLPSIEAYLQGLRARPRHVENGRPLFRRGDPVTHVHYVVTGAVHLVRYQTDGSALILQRAGPGSILAEASLYSGTYHCDAFASGDADLRAYAKAAVKKLLLRSPEFSDIWANYLAQELQRTRLRAEILALRTVSERLDAWIAGHGGSFPPKGEWKLVASQIGVSPEALYRELAKRRY
jgi:CRP-like cAMP-binding protein